jgi:uncharacterized protein (DUF1697 family)
VTRYALLLRGINVGGNKKISMADLRTLLTRLGCADVATLLQSGNAVVTDRRKPAAPRPNSTRSWPRTRCPRWPRTARNSW